MQAGRHQLLVMVISGKMHVPRAHVVAQQRLNENHPPLHMLSVLHLRLHLCWSKFQLMLNVSLVTLLMSLPACFSTCRTWVAALRERGVAVILYGSDLNDKAAYMHCQDAGATAICTDRPSLLQVGPPRPEACSLSLLSMVASEPASAVQMHPAWSPHLCACLPQHPAHTTFCSVCSLRPSCRTSSASTVSMVQRGARVEPLWHSPALTLTLSASTPGPWLTPSVAYVPPLSLLMVPPRYRLQYNAVHQGRSL
jgi:hypothetical protein